jgi:hypothetical protein
MALVTYIVTLPCPGAVTGRLGCVLGRGPLHAVIQSFNLLLVQPRLLYAAPRECSSNPT